jgi:predicted nucleic acid-binding protein
VILVDTSVWVDHIRGRTTPLEDLLGQSRIALHPFVFGELMLMGLPKSGPFSQSAFAKYAEPPVASPSEVAAFIKWAELADTGIGYVDTHILLSAKLSPDGQVVTTDGNLRKQAERIGVEYTP